MGCGSRLVRLYFDWVYTAVYDATVARLVSYHRLHDSCVKRIGLRPGDVVLSIGIGTGNEAVRLLECHGLKEFALLGIDMSRHALVRAGQKARRRGKGVDTLQMDAQVLGLRDQSVDRVLCLHTMLFVDDDRVATRELLRVLKKGGEFVVTYPAGTGSWQLAGEVGADVLGLVRRGRLGQALTEALAALGAIIVYAPLAFLSRRKDGFQSRSKLERMLAGLRLTEYTIDEDPAYQELLVWGRR